MPPTPITLHLPVNGSGKAYITIDRASFSPLSPSRQSPSTRSLPPSQRRKSKPHAFPSSLPSGPTARLTPLNQPIIARCFLPPAPTGSNTSSSSSSSSTSTWSLYPHILELANTRSSHPSPREVARAHRAEQDKVRQKRESAAAARAAAANARKKKTHPSRSRRSSGGGPANAGPTGTHSRGDYSVSPNPNDKVEPASAMDNLATASALADAVNVPAIHTESASPIPSPTGSPSIPQAPHPRSGLKRTRSAGLLSISPSTANALARPVSIGSPLKAVIGPMSDSEDEGDVAKKRPRLGATDGVNTGSDNAPGDRAKTDSPQTGNEGAHAPSGVGVRLMLRRSGSGATAAVLGLGLGVTVPKSEITGSTSMRRAVSASGVDRDGAVTGPGGNAMTRRASASRTASVGPDALRERSRREVVLPARMRDYDMKALA